MSDTYDVIIAGGGPAGSVSALLLARAGVRVCVLEKAHHPRFHIGESILPRNFPLIQELGLEAALRRLPQVPKYGAEFGIGNDPETMKFSFSDGFVPGSPTFNIERAHFDEMLLNEARFAGAAVFEETLVKRIVRLEEGAVEVATADQTFSGRMLLDCSGHGTLVGRHLGTRRAFDDPNLQKVAYFQHFDNVERLRGAASGHPEHLHVCRGMVLDHRAERNQNQRRFRHPAGICQRDRCRRLIACCNGPSRAARSCGIGCETPRDRSSNEVLADFSYTCKPHAGPGYFLVGDAGCFLDPIFSTGVTLAMMGGREAARHTLNILRNTKTPDAARREYCRFVEGSTGVFWRLIRKLLPAFLPRIIHEWPRAAARPQRDHLDPRW